ncbi:MAG: hypothetical protein D6798_01095 [Deltaproteobacteria bacterium]|nr:MAG: hypothetical protein D6798_01095 [Deltaproteobacteria bacterium]
MGGGADTDRDRPPVPAGVRVTRAPVQAPARRAAAPVAVPGADARSPSASRPWAGGNARTTPPDVHRHSGRPPPAATVDAIRRAAAALNRVGGAPLASITQVAVDSARASTRANGEVAAARCPNTANSGARDGSATGPDVPWGRGEVPAVFRVAGAAEPPPGAGRPAGAAAPASIVPNSRCRSPCSTTWRGVPVTRAPA